MFQNLLIKRCFAGSPIYPLNEELRLADLAEQAKLRPPLAERLQILAVMIPGGPYDEDVERRLRSRRAVIEGLGVAGYDPAKDHEIGYFCIPWQALNPNVANCVSRLQNDRTRDERFSSRTDLEVQPTRSNGKQSSDGKQIETQELLVPYEWCEARTFCQGGGPLHLLVLWLADDAFHDAPLARLADLISWFRLKFNSKSGAVDPLPLPNFLVLGPDNSGTLHSMVMEANDAPWNDETRQCLAATHIYSSQAEAAETRLLSDIPDLGNPRTCKHLLEQKLNRPESGRKFCFERTIPLDNQIVEALRKELELRDVKENDDVAILSEEDTFYARALCSSFEAPDVHGVIGPPLCTVHAFTYLRGIDGKIPSDGKDDNESKNADQSTDKNTQPSLRPAEGTEGLNQADDIRRLSKMLEELDKDLRTGKFHKCKSKGLKAIGLLGSDVYDKLELLKALRPTFPEAVFFTNYLDARLAHPEEWKETHNIVVVSARGLSLEGPDKKFQKVAPFRDGGQTALFEATLEAMGRIQPDKALMLNSPLVFEIGQNGAKELRAKEDKDTNELFKEFKRYLRHLSGFIVCGILLVVWTRSVSRVP